MVSTEILVIIVLCAVTVVCVAAILYLTRYLKRSAVAPGQADTPRLQRSFLSDKDRSASAVSAGSARTIISLASSDGGRWADRDGSFRSDGGEAAPTMADELEDNWFFGAEAGEYDPDGTVPLRDVPVADDPRLAHEHIDGTLGTDGFGFGFGVGVGAPLAASSPRTPKKTVGWSDQEGVPGGGDGHMRANMRMVAAATRYMDAEPALDAMRRPAEAMYLVVDRPSTRTHGFDLRVVTFPRVPGFAGLGLVLVGGPPVVISDVEAGSPAYKGGARPGDKILEVNARRCFSLGHHDVVQLMAAAVATEARRREAIQQRPASRLLTRRESGMSLLTDAALEFSHVANVNVDLPGMMPADPPPPPPPPGDNRRLSGGGVGRRKLSAAQLDSQLAGVSVAGDGSAQREAELVSLREEAYGEQARAEALMKQGQYDEASVILDHAIELLGQVTASQEATGPTTAATTVGAGATVPAGGVAGSGFDAGSSSESSSPSPPPFADTFRSAGPEVPVPDYDTHEDVGLAERSVNHPGTTPAQPPGTAAPAPRSADNDRPLFKVPRFPAAPPKRPAGEGAGAVPTGASARFSSGMMRRPSGPLSKVAAAHGPPPGVLSPKARFPTLNAQRGASSQGQVRVAARRSASDVADSVFLPIEAPAGGSESSGKGKSSKQRRRNTIASVPACQQYVGVPLPGDAPSRFRRVGSSTRRDGQLQTPQGAAWGGQDWGLDLGDAAR